MNLTQIQRL